MNNTSVDIDIKKFSNYLADNFEWFSKTLDDVFPHLKKKDEPMLYRRIDHILSDYDVLDRKIVLNIQRGDFFIQGIEAAIPTMNSILMKKTKKRYFVLKEVDFV